MRFEQRLREGIHDGSITVAFRRWKRHQVVPGGRYRTGGPGEGRVEVDSVDVVDPEAISAEDARLAGYQSVAEVLRDLRGDPDGRVFRIALHPLDEPDPRSVLAADDRLSGADVAEISRRLARLDKASPRGPWTAAALAIIAERPDVVATELAVSVGLPRDIFKRNVRSLKTLGLTLSQRVGYRLSPRGQAYREATAGQQRRLLAGDAALQAELVAFGVSEHYPAVAVGPAPVVDDRRAERQDPRQLGVPGLRLGVHGGQVQVNPVLHLFAFRYTDEQQVRHPVLPAQQCFGVFGQVNVVRIFLKAGDL